MSKTITFHACVGVLAVALIVAAAGCSTTNKKHPGVGLGGIHLSALERNEYVIMDTVEGTGKATRFLIFQLPIFKQKLGYTWWASGVETPILESFGSLTTAGKAKAMALYDALAKVPNADSVLPFSTTIESQGIPFFLKIHTATVRAKAIRVKTDVDLGLK